MVLNLSIEIFVLSGLLLDSHVYLVFQFQKRYKEAIYSV